VVLRGPRRPVRYLSFEVNLPEFRVEGQQCVERLGFLAPGGSFNYMADYASSLALSSWLPAGDFSSVLESRGEQSIEVFWRTLVARP
jgi:hypothetical protein